MTRAQWVTISVSVGTPLFVAGLLFLVAPSYMVGQFERVIILSGFEIILLLSLANVLFWLGGFRWRNQHEEKPKRKNDEITPLRFQFGLLLLVMLNFFLCVLPTIWVVVLYPAMVALSMSS